MSKKTLSICLTLLALALSAFGQQASTSDEPATKEQILKFMDLMHVKQQMGQMFEGMKRQARIGAEEGFKQRVSHPTPEQLAKVDAIADEVFNGFPIDELLDTMIPIYQKHLTKTDLEAITAFYSSPAGQRFIKEVPAMMNEAMQAGGEIGRRRMTEANQRIDEKISALAKEVAPEQSKPKSPEPKK
jgi:hypothetical protein